MRASRLRPRPAATGLGLAGVLASAALTASALPATALPATALAPLSAPASAPASVPPSVPVAERAPSGTTAHVLAISIDGLNPDALRRLGVEGAPNITGLIQDGVSTLNARTEVERTTTLPNHTGMLTGRRVAADHGGHGVTWDDGRDLTVQQGAGHPVASVFTEVHGAGGSTALFSAKQKLDLYPRSWPGAIDRAVTKDDEPAVVRAVVGDLAHRTRSFTFLHLARPDRAGHAHGFMGRAYLAAVRRTDEEIGRVLAAADRPALADLVVVLTSDHGGAEGATSHSDTRLLADYTVPFIVEGPGIDAGDLYQNNPDYRDPVADRPGYGARRQPVRNGDLANVVTGLLGLGPVPGSQLDRAQDLTVTR